MSPRSFANDRSMYLSDRSNIPQEMLSKKGGAGNPFIILFIIHIRIICLFLSELALTRVLLLSELKFDQRYYGNFVLVFNPNLTLN